MEDPKEPIDVDQLKRNRRVATIIGSCAIVALIALVYAFVKQIEYNRGMEETAAKLELCQKETEVAMKRAEKAEAEAVRQERIANEQRIAAERAALEARAALEKCSKGKK